MFELGDQAKTEHSNIIQLLRELKLKNVVLVGNEFGKAKGKFLCEHFTSAVDAAQWMKTAPLLNNALILLKGSRGMHLETIITS
jgi:UDP-N-acetylmuramoyl-tripeptide--D-alanyl-D-alanine ligase